MAETIDISEYKTGRIIGERDGLEKGGRIGFVEWAGDRSFKNVHPEPKVGYSIMVDFHRFAFTWLTSAIEEISDDGLTIKTKNSTYKIEYDGETL